MPTPIEYASFLIRLWRESGGDAEAPPAGWQSEIEHIQTGERWSFNSLEQLLDFLRRQARDPGREARPAGSQPE
jgi:hypothetical protein